MRKRIISIALAAILSFVAAQRSQAGPGCMDSDPAGEDTTYKIAGIVKGFEGELVNKAAILILELGQVAESDAKGAFEIPGLPPGRYHLEIYADGYIDYRSEPVELKGANKAITIVLVKKLSNDIVVTATRTPKLYMEVPVKTQVISARQIEQKQATQLAEAISLTTGVRVENNCQNCNFTQVRINGMDGKYSQILIDNSPVFSSMIGVYGLEQFPAEMLNRIEIVKGGGSALYGGNAVAGVINVQTKEPLESGFSLSVQQESQAGEPYTNAGIRTNLALNDGKTKVHLFANTKRRQPVDINADGLSEIGKLGGTNFGLNVFNSFPGVNGKIRLSFYRISENRRGGNAFDLPPHEADVAEAIDTDLGGLTAQWDHYLSGRLFYNFGFSLVDARRETYYGSGQDLNAYGSTKNPAGFLYGQMNYQAGRHLLSGGIQFKGERIEDKALGYGREIDETYREFGVFIQDDVKFSRVLSLLTGLRASRHSLVSGLIVNPRLSLLLNLSSELSWRNTFSTGFRAPQVFDEDLHITQVGGQGMIIENTPGLREESSYSVSSGFDFGRNLGRNSLRMSVEGFYTLLTDTFVLREKEFDPRENAMVFERFNGSNSKVYGLSAEFGYQLNTALSFQSGWTFQRSRLDEPEPDFGSANLFRTPNAYGYVTLNYENTRIVDLDLSLEYTGPMKVPHYAGYIPEDRLETSKPFWVINAKATRQLPLRGRGVTNVILGVFNVLNSYQLDLDVGVYRDSGYVYGPSKPRSFYIGFEFTY